MKFDLSGYKQIVVRPVAGSLGAEIEGVDLSRPLSDPVFREVHRAFLDFHVLFFQDQNLSPDAMASFGGRFGSLFEPPYLKTVDGHKYVHQLIREAEVPAHLRNVGDTWHSDFSPRECPTLGFMLHCVDAPEYGGDTMFANLCLAYDMLSDGMRAICDRLVVVHSQSGMFGAKGAGGGEKKPVVLKGMEKTFSMKEISAAEINHETFHPLVRTHPESGRKILYITGEYSIRFKDMTHAESRPIIDYLNNYVTKPEFVCRFRWRKGAVALLDNRCTQHYAVNDYAGFRRHMLRVEMEGDRPYGDAMPLATGPQRAVG